MSRVVEQLPRIRAFVLLRYTLIIATAYLLLVEHEFSSLPSGLILLIVVALTSNVLVTRLPERIAASTAFNASIIVGDTLWITAGLLYSGHFSADFFYLYFFVLLLAAIGENLFLIAVGAIVSCTAYLFILSSTTTSPLVWSSSSMIRIPFLFTAAAFYGYLVDRVRHEQQRTLAEASTVARLDEIQRELADHARQLERANEALRAAKDYAENLINSSLDMIISADVNRNIVEFNQAAERAFGYSKAEVLGTPIDLLYADPAECSRVNASMLEYGSFTREVTNKRKNGEIFCSYLSGSAMRDANGRVVGTMGISRDITEHKRVEEELKATQLQLIQSEKFESVGRLAAGVAHEVKNPLAVIQQGLAYIADAVSTTDGAAVALVLEKMENAVRRADRVIKGLLDFSVPKAVDMTPVELDAVVEESLLLVKHELIRNHITLVKEVGGNLPPLKLDQHKIEQVFVNLFMNAIQAMRDGGSLTVKTDAKQPPKLRSDGGGTLVVVEVEDTGTGIPDDELDRVFDPFFTTKPPGQGTGLGLTVARKIMDLHGGTIDIRNRQEGGVRVTLTFKTDAGRKDAEEVISARTTGGKRHA